MEERPSLTTRTAPPGVATPASAPPDATPLVIPVDAPAPGRARPAAPLRREGPAKLTGEAKYADDLVFPGAWFGATIRSTEPHARLEAIELDDAFDWKRVVVVTSDDIPGENLVSLIQDDQPVLVPVGGEIRHQAEPCALIAAPDRATLRAARAHVKLRTTGCPPRSTRSSRITSSRTTPSSAGTRRAAMEDADTRHRGHVSGRPPGAALHREPGDDRRSEGGRRRHRPRLAPMPVLHPQGDEARAEHGRRARGRRPGRDRRRVRRQGGVPIDDRPPRRAPGAEVPQAGADDLRPPRGHQRHDQASPGRRPQPMGRLRTPASWWPRTSR